MSSKKHIIVSVTNDLVADQRVHKVCTFLQENNYMVTLVGRKLSNSLPVERTYKTKRLRLLFTKGPLFYAFFNFRLFFFLLFRKVDVLLSNDLDTLLPNYFVSKLRGKKLIYDSHEYFTEVPELVGRPKVKAIWEKLEKRLVPKVDKMYTVNESLAKMYAEKYNREVLSVVNLPYYKALESIQKPETFTVIYQGALNKDRGLEELLQAFTLLKNMNLWIIGDGDVAQKLKEISVKLNLSEKVKFFGKLPFEQLRQYTLQAHVGVSLEKSTNLSYEYATPNKVFDYISAGLPVLTCSLPEIKRIVTTYDVGTSIATVESNTIAEKLHWYIENPDQLKIWSKNAEEAAKELCWEKQISTLFKIYLA